MEHLTRKVLKRLEEMGAVQSRAAEAAGVDSARFSRILKGQGKLSAEQLLKLARFLAVPMDYLADPEMEEPSAETGLSPSQRTVLMVYDSLYLSEQEAIRRLALHRDEERSPGDQPPAGDRNRRPAT